MDKHYFILACIIYSAVIGTSRSILFDDCLCLGQCPDGWIKYQGSCYYMFETKSTNWLEATHHCEIHGSHLVTIETKDEDLFLRAEIKRLYRQNPGGNEFWIGATDSGKEGAWVWYYLNSTLSYTDWYPGQPGSNGRDEDCAVIAASTSFIGWHDAPCSALHHPICEKDVTEIGQEVVGK